MAVSEKAIGFLGNSLAKGKAIPGQSLTNSPEDKYKWESPAEFTNSREASMYIFETVTVPETTANLLISVINGVGIIDLASIILYSGFLEGKWNPDLMTILMEPTMYMIMALAEKAEINYVLDAGEDEKTKQMSPDKEVELMKSNISEFDNLKKQATQQINKNVIPKEVQEMIDSTELSPSLLEKVKSNPSSSLLGKGE
jgi:hypothetical protein